VGAWPVSHTLLVFSAGFVNGFVQGFAKSGAVLCLGWRGLSVLKSAWRDIDTWRVL
jgi:hypothetical protein